MHFIAAWRFYGNQRRDLIDEEFKTALKDISWVRPMIDFYIINVPELKDYNAVTEKLIEIAKKYQSSFYMVISPPISGGRYMGWLKKDLWGEINKISN